MAALLVVLAIVTLPEDQMEMLAQVAVAAGAHQVVLVSEMEGLVEETPCHLMAIQLLGHQVIHQEFMDQYRNGALLMTLQEKLND